MLVPPLRIFAMHWDLNFFERCRQFLRQANYRVAAKASFSKDANPTCKSQLRKRPARKTRRLPTVEI
jgi:L-ascorbate metabolism protein UlaG (beta-lactamase superfamily)